MKRQRTDRRVQRTRKQLLESLIALILEKSYEAVSVQDIVDHANIGRSTFYAHFESKEQLLMSGHQELMEMIFQLPERPEQGSFNFKSLYEHAKEHGNVAKAMLGKKGGNLVVNHLRSALALKLFHTLQKKRVAEKKLLEYKAEAIASALISLLTSWLDDDMVLPIEKMVHASVEIYDKLV